MLSSVMEKLRSKEIFVPGHTNNYVADNRVQLGFSIWCTEQCLTHDGHTVLG